MSEMSESAVLGDFDVGEEVVGNDEVIESSKRALETILTDAKPIKRRKVSSRKRVGRPKQRGRYKRKPKSSTETVERHTPCERPSPSPSPHEEHSYFKAVAVVEEPLGEGQPQDAGPSSATSEDISNLEPDVPLDHAECGSNVNSPPVTAIASAVEHLINTLSEDWIVISDTQGFHLLMMSQTAVKIIQREIYLKFDGLVDVIVHCAPLPLDNEIVKFWPAPAIFVSEDYKDFCNKAVALCKGMMQYQVCTGAAHQESRNLWPSIPDSYVDLNPYLEKSYKESCRSTSCQRLVPLRYHPSKCASCSRLWKLLRRRKSLTDEDLHPTTPNQYLNPQQVQQKLKTVQEDKRKMEKRISYLESIINKLKNKS